jgi:hypothetical protein
VLGLIKKIGTVVLRREGEGSEIGGEMGAKWDSREGVKWASAHSLHMRFKPAAKAERALSLLPGRAAEAAQVPLLRAQAPGAGARLRERRGARGSSGTLSCFWVSILPIIWPEVIGGVQA